ncbi:proteinase B [Tilletia horrida]|uniref:Proteinase B n=1 Tax=Tilletia horrida TaxID=155126 RepID=A0AAN6GSE4_9BASI|nr:proteinase B [Tilletia horrida]KAK0554290.1 proteinase B [Tilletia horrida]KAK0563381.1 proteinase B [Tilletia horrida]
MRIPISAAAIALALSGAAIAAPTVDFFVPGRLHYTPNPAPIHSLSHAESIPNSYMVVLKKGVSTTDFLAHQALIQSAITTAASHHASSSSATPSLKHIYSLGDRMQGYAGTFSDDLLAYIRAQPEVDYVERDSVVSVTMLPDDGSKIYNGPSSTDPEWASTFTTTQKETARVATPTPLDDIHVIDKDSVWGLARISHRKALGFGTFKEYLYDRQAGEGVTAYIIDTGINIKHNEFEGRARWGKTLASDGIDSDGNGHGTHCAGTIGSRAYGVAKKADLVAVKVLGSGGSGSMADVTQGVLWAAQNAADLSAKYASEPHSAAAQKHKGFVASMSLGGGRSIALNQAVDSAVESGLHFTVAAGNENSDACNVSPAGAKRPITVGASTVQDERAYFSNKGKCVDVFAPGLGIKSTWNTGPDSTNTISGTSMATPHVAGLVAYLLSIYGTDEFHKIKGASGTGIFANKAAAQPLYVQSTATSFASKFVSALPLPAMVFDYVNGLFGLKGDADAELVRGSSSDDVSSVLAPSALKKAIEALSSPDLLGDIDRDTANLLVFNNVTKPGK